jgi:hypothetical protein
LAFLSRRRRILTAKNAGFPHFPAKFAHFRAIFAYFFSFSPYFSTNFGQKSHHFVVIRARFVGIVGFRGLVVVLGFGGGVGFAAKNSQK